MSKVKTHEQYEVAVQQAYDAAEGRWYNAVHWYPGSKAGQRYVNTKTEAKKVLKHAYELWNGPKSYDSSGKRYESQGVGMIGISIEYTRDTDEQFRIVKHRIRKRIVTEWEVIEEK